MSRSAACFVSHSVLYHLRTGARLRKATPAEIAAASADHGLLMTQVALRTLAKVGA